MNEDAERFVDSMGNETDGAGVRGVEQEVTRSRHAIEPAQVGNSNFGMASNTAEIYHNGRDSKCDLDFDFRRKTLLKMFGVSCALINSNPVERRTCCAGG